MALRPRARRAIVSVMLAVAVLVSPGAALSAAGAEPIQAVQTTKRGLTAAVKRGRIAPADAARYRAILARTAYALPRLSGARKANLRAVLDDVADKAGQYTAPRALTLFSMLDVNTRYFGSNTPPRAKSDVLGPDMVIYRYFPGHGLQFHPLGNFGALNAHLAAGQLDEARQLSEALRARAFARVNGTTVWEYEFRYAGGKPPWTSGMAQAVAAQSLARASEKLDDRSLLELARRAYAAIPGKLTRKLPAGPWVKLYSFSSMAVLNAQLQTTVAIRDFAEIADDNSARASATPDPLPRACASVRPSARAHPGERRLAMDMTIDERRAVVEALRTNAALASAQAETLRGVIDVLRHDITPGRAAGLRLLQRLEVSAGSFDEIARLDIVVAERHEAWIADHEKWQARKADGDTHATSHAPVIDLALLLNPPPAGGRAA